MTKTVPPKLQKSAGSAFRLPIKYRNDVPEWRTGPVPARLQPWLQTQEYKPGSVLDYNKTTVTDTRI